MIPQDMRLSFTALAAYENCPQSFKLSKLDRVPDDGNFYSDFGSFCHS